MAAPWDTRTDRLVVVVDRVSPAPTVTVTPAPTDPGGPVRYVVPVRGRVGVLPTAIDVHELDRLTSALPPVWMPARTRCAHEPVVERPIELEPCLGCDVRDRGVPVAEDEVAVAPGVALASAPAAAARVLGRAQLRSFARKSGVALPAGLRELDGSRRAVVVWGDARPLALATPPGTEVWAPLALGPASPEVTVLLVDDGAPVPAATVPWPTLPWIPARVVPDPEAFRQAVARRFGPRAVESSAPVALEGALAGVHTVTRSSTWHAGPWSLSTVHPAPPLPVVPLRLQPTPDCPEGDAYEIVEARRLEFATGVPLEEALGVLRARDPR